MPANPGYQPVSVFRLSRIMDALQDVRETPGPLLIGDAIPTVPAEEGEIMGRFIGRAIIADILPDDATAGVYSSGKMTFETMEVPNIKMGRSLTQSQINQFQRIRSAGVSGENAMTEFLFGIMRNIDLGLQWRREALCVAMALDNFTYDRLGVKAAGVTWGMPSDLKVTPTYPWTDTTNGDPIGDIQSILLVASQRYGRVYNRVTMSTTAFRKAVACTKYQNLARALIPAHLTFGNLSLLNLPQQQSLFENTLGCQLRLYDTRYWASAANGELRSAPFLPITQVIIDSTGNDNNSSVHDFANGVVTESLVADAMPQAMGSVVGSFPSGGIRGPVGWAEGSLNPPNMTMWGAMRGFPRKHDLAANAVLTVGAFNDLIAVGEPF